uniref:ISXO2-like transposase domain-containing protein n=1 Tax=Plectus sambesii TaxID=2011161 RepID=A0A914UHI2_9BILA
MEGVRGIKQVERDLNLIEVAQTVGSEEAAVNWCKGNGLLPDGETNADCWKEYKGVKCPGTVYTTTKSKGEKAYPVFCCRKCKATKTPRAGTCAINPHHQSGLGQIGGRGTWFTSIDKLDRNSSQLLIHVILMLLWGWARRFSFDQMCSIFGGFIGTANNHLLMDWFYYIHEMIADYLENGAAPMGGLGSEVQIDESFFGGRRKYNRGWLLVKDQFERRRP